MKISPSVMIVLAIFSQASAFAASHSGGESTPNRRASAGAAPETLNGQFDKTACRAQEFVNAEIPGDTKEKSEAREPYPIPRGQGVAYLEEKDYARNRLLLLYAFSKMEDVLKKSPKDARAVELQAVIDNVKKRVQDGTLPMGNYIANTLNAAILTMNGRKGAKPVFVFGKDFVTDYFNDPVLMQGTIIHELQHLMDIEKIGFGDNRVRVQGLHESRGHLAQADFYRIAKAAGIESKNGRFALMIDAAAKGTDSDDWKRYLAAQQGVDYARLNRFQLYQHDDLPKLKDADSHKPFTDQLVPAAEAAKDDIKTLEELAEKVDKIEKGSADFKNLQAAHARVETYVTGATALNAAVMDHIGRPTDAALVAQRRWATLHNDVGTRYRAVMRNAKLVAALNSAKDEAKPTDAGKTNLRDFEKWIEGNPGVQKLGAILKSLCDRG